jgi:hypothetical protein
VTTAIGRETCGIVVTDWATGFAVVVVFIAAAAGVPPEVAVAEAVTTVFSLLSGAVLGVDDEAFGCIAASFSCERGASVWSKSEMGRRSILTLLKVSFFSFFHR